MGSLKEIKAAFGSYAQIPDAFPNLPVRALSAPMLIKPEALALADAST